MTTINFNLRLDQDLRDRAFPVFERYGLSAAQAFKLFLNQVAETKTIPLSFNYAAKESTLTPKAAEKLLQSIKEIENGKYTKHETVEDAIKYLSGVAHD